MSQHNRSLDTARRRILKTSAACLMVPAAMRARAQSPSSGMLTLGQTLVWPSLTLLGGETLPPSHFEGHTTVIYWWASWCPFCREQTPEMQKLWVRHSAQGLRMLGISVDAKAEAARQYLIKSGLTFPCVLSTEDVTRVLPRPRGVPVTAAVDKRGRVTQVERGQMFPEDVAALGRWL